MALRILTDQQRGLEMRKVFEQTFMPKWCALGARRQITAIFSGTGITQSHGKDRHLSFVVKDRPIHLQPAAEPITACITPGDPALMRFASRRLTNDQQASGARQLHDGAGTRRQMGGTDLVCANFTQ
jgi:hypothetical protein